MKDLSTKLDTLQEKMIQEYCGVKNGFRPINNGKFTPKKKKRKKK